MTLKEIFDMAIDYNNFFAEAVDAGYSEEETDEFWHSQHQNCFE